ncbi:MAG: ATP-dependent helicase HrpB [Deltaproteobacteria bacterium]|nr:ATP-dependent helicase HrpB [Deltaproteobacteria bacterium]
MATTHAPLLPLPIDPVVPELVAALRRESSAVLLAPPGAGKTTRVPPALLEAELFPGQLLVLQPRRVAARAIARRIADERGFELGREVGYQVRFERCLSHDTRLRVVTEGILTRMLQQDPLLEGVGGVILDEFHERNLHSELALALLREVQTSVRPELRIVVMSATLDPAPVAAFLGGCPVLEAEAHSHPLEVQYAEREDRRPLPVRTAATVERALRDDPSGGHVLAFLPGVGEIRATLRALEGLRGVEVLPLHGTLSAEEQDRVLAPSRQRRAILATNVAETSLTIEGVTSVVDSGLVRLQRHDPRTGIDQLVLTRISVASANQRAGRAGRTGPGRVYRLWTRAQQVGLAPFTVPEIRRVDLAPTVLEVRAWGSDPLTFGWFEAPEPSLLERADRLLVRLGALAEGARTITADGKRLLGLPVHPRLGRLLLEAHRRGCLREGAGLAALLAERDILRLDRGPSSESVRASELPTGPSDLLLRLELLFAATESTASDLGPTGLPLDRAALRHARRAAAQLEREAARAFGPPARSRNSDDAAPLRLLLAAFPERVTRRREPGSPRGLMVGGRGVVLDPRSVVREAPFFLSIAVDGAGPEARVLLASQLDPAWLSRREEVVCEFDADRQQVIAARRLLHEDLCLEEARAAPPAEAAAELLATEAAKELSKALTLDGETGQILARLRCLAAWMPELGLPACDDDALVALLPELCHGRRSFADLRAVELGAWIVARLEHAQRQALERHAPTRLAVPSGSQVRLDYAPGRAPVLAVRLQELFGLADTPRIAAGRTPVLLHLLSPAGRPVQVTQDLRSFWNTTYPEVRKELRARYPKHAWPEDPWNAPPERRPRRRS